MLTSKNWLAAIIFSLFATCSGFAQAENWVSPTSHNDPDKKWTFENRAYDGSESLYAEDRSDKIGVGSRLELFLDAPILCSRLNVLSDWDPNTIVRVHVDVRPAGTTTWKNVFLGSVKNVAWTEITFPQQTIDGVRWAYEYKQSGIYFWLYELRAFEDALQVNSPVAKTETAESVEGVHANLVGSVLDDGGQPCDYRFEWGLTAKYSNATPWILAADGKGVTTGERFTSAITGLATGAAYHFRSSVRNANGVSFGVDRVFVTHPSNGPWISPTSFEDPSGLWENAAQAYDSSTSTAARHFHKVGKPLWSEPLILSRPVEICDRVRFFAKDDQNIDAVRIESRSSVSGSWESIYEGPFADQQWVEIDLPNGARAVQALRVAFKISKKNFGQFWEMAEVQLHSVTNRWTNSAGGFQWNQAGNWSLGHVPVAGEAVVFDTSTQATCEAAPHSVVQNLHSLAITSGYQGRIICAAGFAEGFSQVLNVANDVTVNGGSLIFTSKIISTIFGEGVTINAANFTIGSGAVVHSDERGFPAQQGPGSSDRFSFGPSAGGRGEDNVTNLEYGNPTTPSMPGSGGSTSTGDASSPGGQAGGGAVKINVGIGIIRIDGQLRANGAPDGFHNSGAGGSLHLVCGTFEGLGSGLIQSKGGNISHPGRSPGGGGRVAVNWSNNSTFAGNFDVSGGSDSQTHGQPGTLWLPSGSDLIVKAPYKIGLAPGAHSFGNVVIEAGAELFCHSSFSDNSTFSGCQVNANSITIEAGGVISADEDGFAPADIGIISGPGGSANGGSHGGRGAGGLSAYGDPLNPVTLGSGGSKGSWPGSNTRSPRWGGGALKLTVTGALSINGSIRSNGGYHGGGDKGGAGGSVHVVCNSLSGSGTIQANGGGSSSGNAGGGRIALEYNTSSFTGSASAAGSGTGEAGSVIPGNLSLAGHVTGQTNDSFQSTGNVTAQLLRFSLKPAGNTDDSAFENVEISKLAFDLTHISGIASGDISNISIYVDTNGDGLTTDESGPIAATGATVSVTGDSGVLIFNFAAGALVLDGTTATTNYILLANVSNLVVGDALKVSLISAGTNIQATDVDSNKTISESNTGYAQLSGNVSSAIHQIASGDITTYSFSVGLTQTQGSGFSATLTARDTNNNSVDALVEVTLSSDGNAVFYTDNTYSITTTTATLEHGSATLFVKDDSIGSLILTATDVGTNSGNSLPILINPTPVVSYKFESATTQIAGMAWQVTLTAMDGQNGTGTRINTEATTTLTSTGSAGFYADVAATQPISSIALLGGQAILYVKDNIAEVMRLQASDSAGKTGTSADITVASGAITSYAVTGTSPRIKGQGFSETVTAQDAFGNTVLTATNSITLTNTGSASFYKDSDYLAPSNIYLLSGGVASIHLKDDTLETIVLTATDSNAKTGNSPPITVSLSIQQRIDLATAGDTIIIAHGEYHESFIVNKPLTITTANPSFPNKPIIDGDGVTYVCEIAASDVIIEGLEFRDSSSHLIFSQGEFEAGGVAHANTYNRVTIRHCVMHDGGGDGVVLRNIFDGKIESCVAWDVNGNGIFMDGVGNAVVKHNEVKGAGNMVRGILINWCYPATVEDNYIHDLYDAESALYFTSNWSGNHSIRNNVITNNKLRDMVSWHPYGGSALAVRKPTMDGTTATVNIEHNSIVGNSGQGPFGVTGHAIAWDWNGSPGLTMVIKNNLTFENSGRSFATRKDSVDYGFAPLGGIFDFNDCTEGIHQPFDVYAVGFNNIASPPTFTTDPDVYGKYIFRLQNCPARGAGDDGFDMGAILIDPTGSVAENIRIQLILGESENHSDDLVDIGSLLNSSVKVSANNPWGIFPASVRVFIGSSSSGTGMVEFQTINEAITFVDVALDLNGSGSASFQIKGVSASTSENDVEVRASFDSRDGADSAVVENLTVLEPGSYTLVTSTFRVEDAQGKLIDQSAYIEVDGIGIIRSSGTLNIRDGTAITYRVLSNYGQTFGGLMVAGADYTGIVTSTNAVFVGTVDDVMLQARDQNGTVIQNALVAVEDTQGRRSGFVPTGTKLLLPIPGTYKALGKLELTNSDGTDVVAIPLVPGNAPYELLAPFRKVTFLAKDQNGTEYPSAIIKVVRGTLLGKSLSGYSIKLPVGAKVDLTVERHEYEGIKEEVQVRAATTELSASLRQFSVVVNDVATQTPLPDAAWRLLRKGFEKSYGTNNSNLTMPLGVSPVIEGFVWDASTRSTPMIDSTLDSVEIALDSSILETLKITSPSWSFFSNGFIEGIRSAGTESVMLEVLGNSNTLPVNATLLGNTRWYGYLPLDANGAITVRATATNKYGQTATVEQIDLVWQKVLIGTASSKLVPINSKLLLTTDATDVEGADAIDIIPGDGQARIHLALGEYAEVTYPTFGEFSATALVLDAAGQILDSRTVSITVVQITSSPTSFASNLKFTRSISWDIFPGDVRLLVDLASVDPTLLKLSNIREEPSSQSFPNRLLADIKPYEPSGPLGSGVGGGIATYQDLNLEEKKEVLLRNHPAFALRVGGAEGEGGWIPNSIHSNINEFELYSEGRVLTMFKFMDDGSYEGTTWIRMIPKLDGLDVTVTGIGGSSLNYQGAGKFTFKTDDMNDEDGRFPVPTGKGKGGSVCHSVNVYQTTKKVGETGLTNAPWAAALVDGGLYLLRELSDESDQEFANIKKPNLDEQWLQKHQVWDGDDAKDVRSNGARARWFAFRGHLGGGGNQGQVIVDPSYFETKDPSEKFYEELRKNLHIPHRPVIGIVELNGGADNVKNLIEKWWLKMEATNLHTPDSGDEMVLNVIDDANLEVDWAEHGSNGWLPQSSPLPGRELRHGPVAMNFYHPRLRAFIPDAGGKKVLDQMMPSGVLTFEKPHSWDPGAQIKNWGGFGGQQYVEETNPGAEDLFVDFGFLKGNRVGGADIKWFGAPNESRKDKGLWVDPCPGRPGVLGEDEYLYSLGKYELQFEDVIHMARLEIDGFEFESESEESTLSTRDAFPLVKVNVFEDDRAGVIWEVTESKDSTLTELTFRGQPGEWVLAAIAAADKLGYSTDDVWVTFDKEEYFEREKLNPTQVFKVDADGSKVLAKRLISTRMSVPSNPQWTSSKKVYIHCFKHNAELWDYKIVTWGQERYSKTETGVKHHDKALKRWWTNLESGEVEALPLNQTYPDPWIPRLLRWAVTDQELFNAAKISYFVEGPDGGPRETEVFADTNTTPILSVVDSLGNDLDASDFTILNSTEFKVYLMGELTDDYLKIRPDSLVARPQKIHVTMNGKPITDLTISYTPKIPTGNAFRQYDIKGTFKGTLELPMVDGEFEIRLESDSNAFGNLGVLLIRGEMTKQQEFIEEDFIEPELEPDAEVLARTEVDEEPYSPSSPFYPGVQVVRSNETPKLNWVSIAAQPPAGPFNPIIVGIEAAENFGSLNSEPFLDIQDGDELDLKAFTFSPKRLYIIEKNKPNVPKAIIVTASGSIKEAKVQKNIDKRIGAGFIILGKKVKKENLMALAFEPGIGFVGATISNAINTYLGNLTITKLIVKRGKGEKADNVTATLKGGPGAYTFDLISTGAAVHGIRNVDLTIRVDKKDRPLRFFSGVSIAKLRVTSVDFIETNEDISLDRSEDPTKLRYWLARNKVGVETSIGRKAVIRPVVFQGHPVPKKEMPKVKIKATFESIPQVAITTPIRFTGNWAVSSPKVIFNGSLKLTGSPVTLTLTSEKRLLETNPIKIQRDLEWTGAIGAAGNNIPIDSTPIGDCYFLWSKPIWTGSQLDTESRNFRISDNYITPHRLETMYSGTISIVGATSAQMIADRLYDLVEATKFLARGIYTGKGSEAKNKKTRSSHWKLWLLKRGIWHGQCGERSRLLERKLVMLGIDAKHHHAFVPRVEWARNDPNLVIDNGVGRRLLFPAALTDNRIGYHDNIGDNAGEGCLILANNDLPGKFGDPNQTVIFGAHRVRRKYIFGRYYAMFTGNRVIEDSDLTKEVTGAYKVLLRLMNKDELVTFTLIKDDQFRIGVYSGWKNIGFPEP